MEFEVSQEESGGRLDVVLATRVTHVSRMFIRTLIDHEEARVDGVPRPAGYHLKPGERVSLTVPEDAPTAMTPEPIPLSVLLEDSHLIVLEKPAGMVVHPAGRHRSGTLVNALAHHFNVAGGAIPSIRPGLAHRLDRATSGLMVVAKTQVALSRLTVAFQQKRVEKRYLALVQGCQADDSGDWHAPIGNDPEERPCWGIREEGRPAHTRYRVVERFACHTLLELEPVTGRTNQLRLHCAHFGHPIVGDELFGAGTAPGLERLFLHAHRLTFPHPMSSVALSFESPLPDELLAHMASLRECQGQ